MGRAVQGLIGGVVLLLGVGLGLRGPELWAELRDSPGRDEGVTDAGEAAPVAGEAAPVAGEAAPVAQEPAPVAGEAAPVAGEPAPVAGEAAPVAGEAAPVAPPSSMGPPEGPPPPALPADLAGPWLVSLRPGGVLEARRVDSAAALERPARRLAAPGGPVERLCTDGTVLALAGPTDIELRTLADDRFLERLRPAHPRVDRVLCPGGGAVVAVALGSAGVATWWDGEGRELGRLQPPSGIVAVVEDADQVLVLDGSGELRAWDGRRRQSLGPLGHEGVPAGLSAALGGLPWALFPQQACQVGGDCLDALGARGLAATGEGWLAVAGPDRVQLTDTVGRRLLHELPARPTGVFVAPSGALLVVEPDGLRIFEPATGGELRALRW